MISVCKDACGRLFGTAEKSGAHDSFPVVFSTGFVQRFRRLERSGSEASHWIR